MKPSKPKYKIGDVVIVQNGDYDIQQKQISSAKWGFEWTYYFEPKNSYRDEDVILYKL